MEENKESVRGGCRQAKNNIDACTGIRIVLLKNIELLKLGYRIRGARKVLGYSQKVFAAKCGLDRSCLGGVERGERNITFGILCAICDGTDASERLPDRSSERTSTGGHPPLYRGRNAQADEKSARRLQKKAGGCEISSRCGKHSTIKPMGAAKPTSLRHGV